MRLTSTHNPVIKYVRSLERAAVRREGGVYLAEGVLLVHEAMLAGQTATVALYDPDTLQRTAEGTTLLANLAAWTGESYEVGPQVLKAAAQTEHPSGVLAVFRLPTNPPLEVHREALFGVILDNVSDPGNAGAIIRTATAAGAAYLVTTPDSVDLFSPKVVRAGMGAHFKLPLYQAYTWHDLGRALPDIAFVAASTTAAQSLYGFAWPDRCALVVGSESHGLSAEARSIVHVGVRIPMSLGVESLNAAVAAGILMYAARASSLSFEAERYK